MTQEAQTSLVWPESSRVKQGIRALNNIIYRLYLLISGFVYCHVSYLLNIDTHTVLHGYILSYLIIKQVFNL